MKLGEIANALAVSGLGLIFGFLIAWGYLFSLNTYADLAITIDSAFIVLAVILWIAGIGLIYFRRKTISWVAIITGVVLLAPIILRFLGYS